MTTGMQDKIAQQIIDIFVRESEILELLPFDNAVSPTGGSTLVYGYVQEKVPSTASFRAIGSEYTHSEAILQQLAVTLKVFGGSFQVDRVIKSVEAQLESVNHQVQSKIKAAVALFHDTMINGDSATNNLAFDGLNKMLVGTKTEYNSDSYIDLSTMDKLKENADVFYEALLKLINSTNATAIMVNGDMKTKIQTVARVLGYKTESEEAFGRVITTIGENKVRIIDLKNKYSVSGETVTETPIVGVQKRTIGEAEVTGLTDIYSAKFDGYDGFLGVTVAGNKIIDSYLPDFTQAGAVKTGEVEMIGAVALKNSRNAGVLRNIKII
ncbi:hypothetical protein M9Y10_013529 [Tritrichomonas musculus]|uniref:Phage capsid protein n=1 Tax=Tritrichomonas musculus TaxID=1915356 RepID=A0ABR2GN34_9EUKA